MPRFTDEKRAEIRRALLGAGYEQFTDAGLGGTTIAELTEEAGIATGTFYSFFDSKEELLAAVLRHEAEHVYADLRVVLREHADDPETALRQFVQLASESLVDNRLFRRTISRDDRERLLEALPEEEVLSTRSEKVSLLAPSIREWQERGLVAGGDPETIAQALLYLSYLPLHREEVGPDRYQRVRRTLLDWAISSLCTG